MVARGYCGKHYQQATRGEIYVGQRDLSDEDRFWLKVDKNGPLPPDRPDLGLCWIWTAGCVEDGYGVFWLDGKNRKAHRVAYQWLIGPIPEGLEPDHLCRNRPCVNPSHMELVTNHVNVLRGTSPWAVNKRKTHCPDGHEYTPENTRIDSKGGRTCITCERARCRAYYRKRKALERTR